MHLSMFSPRGSAGQQGKLIAKCIPAPGHLITTIRPAWGDLTCHKKLFLNFTFYFATFYRHVLGLCQHFQNAGLYAATILVAMATKFYQVATNIFGGHILRLTLLKSRSKMSGPCRYQMPIRSKCIYSWKWQMDE